MDDEVKNLLEKEFKILKVTPPKVSPFDIQKSVIEPIKTQTQKTQKPVKPKEEVKVKVETDIKSFIKSPELRGLIDYYEKQKEITLDPISKRMADLIEKQKEVYSELNKQIESFSKELDKYYANLKRAQEEKLPEAPKYEEVTAPKNAFISFLKRVVPNVIGIIALFKGGKYGENYVYFNSMVDAIKKNDMEQFEKSLMQWKLDFDKALREKQQKLNILKTEGEALAQKFNLSSKQKDILLKSIESDIKSLTNLYNEAHKSINNFFNIAFKMWKAEEDLKTQRMKISMLTKIKGGAEEDRTKEALRISQIMKNINDYIKDEKTRDAMLKLIVNTLYGLPPNKRELEEVIKSIDQTKTNEEKRTILEFFELFKPEVNLEESLPYS